ncbi:MAG: hypothetical protein JXB19_10995 [Bacteroidales bacterium]|nr:hypothetical protein [Bacteroidales bacterium]
MKFKKKIEFFSPLNELNSWYMVEKDLAAIRMEINTVYTGIRAIKTGN